jgi:sulfatase maturation enzyme AslB (radical SAM superfamily)
VESSPTANQHPLLSYETFKEKLDEALAKDYDKLEIYFTGGEPFVNPDMLVMIEEAIKHADTTILTNATRISGEVAEKLRVIDDNSPHDLIFRVSLDGPNAEMNDKIRGKQAFDRATQGLENLIGMGFNPIVTSMRSWSLLDSGRMEDQYIDLLVEKGIPREDQLLKILPPLRLGREVQRTRSYTNDELFTEECFNDYDYSKLQCSKCRMVSERGVWVCPILINDDEARMGDTLEDAAEPYAMRQMACWTCRMDGMSCEN